MVANSLSNVLLDALAKCCYNRCMTQELNLLIEAARKHRGHWQSLAKDADVSYSWLVKFANWHIPNPGVSTIDKLSRALQQRDLAA